MVWFERNFGQKIQGVSVKLENPGFRIHQTENCESSKLRNECLKSFNQKNNEKLNMVPSIFQTKLICHKFLKVDANFGSSCIHMKHYYMLIEQEGQWRCDMCLNPHHYSEAQMSFHYCDDPDCYDYSPV